MPRDSAKERIRAFLLANIGTVVNARQLSEVARPVSEWARRVRELREQEGWLSPSIYRVSTPRTAERDVGSRRVRP